MKTILNHFSIKTKMYIAIILLLSFSNILSQTSGANFQVGPTMMHAKLYPAATVLNNGKVISFGGRQYNFISCTYADVYDPATNTFSELTMNYPHDGFAVVKMNDGRYFLIGGSKDLGVAPGYATTEMYDPTTNTFTSKASMGMARMQVGAAQLNSGKVLVAGAWYSTSGAASAELYDPVTDAFSATNGLVQPRSQAMIIPTTDGGAILTGGWPTYGGTSYRSVEYFSSTTNAFTAVSSELIPTDPGWLVNAIYTRPIADCKMSNGNYLLLAYRNSPNYECALISFNPTTKEFTKMSTSTPLKDSLTDGGFFDVILNKSDNKAYVLGVDSGATPQRLSLLTVNLTTGEIYHPTSAFTLPVGEYFYPTLTYIPSVGKILAQGINGSNNSHFTGTNKTYLITPQTNVGIAFNEKGMGAKMICYPNPASSNLSIEIPANQQGVYKLAILDLSGQLILKIESKLNLSDSNIINLDISKISQGVYFVQFETNLGIETKSVFIAR